MVTQIFIPNKKVKILQGEEIMVFKPDMIIGIPNQDTKKIDKFKIKEVVFLVNQPASSIDSVSLIQQVFTTNEK
jgi:hypothetical protein